RSAGELVSKVCTFNNMGKNTRNSNNDSTSSTEEAVKRVVKEALQDPGTLQVPSRTTLKNFVTDIDRSHRDLTKCRYRLLQEKLLQQLLTQIESENKEKG
ncbi:hypothetical protein L9F63_020917, partial [Diploptera punctata]